MSDEMDEASDDGSGATRCVRCGFVLCCAQLIAAACCVLSPAAQAQALPPGLDTGLLSRIDAFVANEVESSGIPGVALAIVHDGRVLHGRGFGHDGRGRPITQHTPFPIGSLTKSFTALATRQLVEAGKIDVDAPLQRYLPWFRVADPQASAQITVRHLLNQTSGLSRAAGMQPLIDRSMASTDELARGLRDVPLNRPVGGRYEYSNLNFVLLGALVESVSGHPWSELIQQRILKPLSMQHSHVDFDSARRDAMTNVHRYWFGVPVRHDLAFLPGMAPAGYLVSSADDMGRYLAMMLRGGEAPRGRVLSALGVSQMLAPATAPTRLRLLSTAFEARYAEGWFAGPFGAAADTRWHLGTLPSFAAWMVLLPDTRQAVVVLINANGELPLTDANQALSRIPIGVVNLLRGQAPPLGQSMRRAYAMFDVAALLLLGAVAAWGWRVGRQGRVPSIVATGIAAALLAATPLGVGLGWGTLAQFAPDLALVLAACVLMLIAPLVAWLLRRPVQAVTVMMR